MKFALPLFAVQRLANGTWLVRTQMGDPILPAVDVVAVVGAPTSAAPRGTFFNSCSITGALCPRTRRDDGECGHSQVSNIEGNNITVMF